MEYKVQYLPYYCPTTLLITVITNGQTPRRHKKAYLIIREAVDAVLLLSAWWVINKNAVLSKLFHPMLIKPTCARPINPVAYSQHIRGFQSGTRGDILCDRGLPHLFILKEQQVMGKLRHLTDPMVWLKHSPIRSGTDFCYYGLGSCVVQTTIFFFFFGVGCWDLATSASFFLNSQHTARSVHFLQYPGHDIWKEILLMQCDHKQAKCFSYHISFEQCPYGWHLHSSQD